MAIDKRFLVERSGRTFALFAGLLDAAHREGLKSIETQLLQIGAEENHQTWLFRAVVVTDKGTYTGHGDANPSNVNGAMLKVLPRMAETRSIARALRFAVNAEVAALEELDEEEAEHPAPRPAPRPAPTPQPPTGIAPPVQREPTPIQNGQPISDNQRKAIFAIMKSLDYDVEDIEGACQHRYQVKVSQLSRVQASEFIDVLKGLQGEKAAR